MKNLIYQFQLFILSCIERINVVFSRVGDDAFFEVSQFNWIAGLEANVERIRHEFLAIGLEAMPNVQDISVDQQALTTDQKWKAFGLYFYGYKIPENYAKCPVTANLLDNVDGLKTAFFSVLSPSKHIPPHRGVYNGILRYHLGVLVPSNNQQCGIKVGEEMRYWQEGASLVFNDRHRHEAWNNTEFTRVVLIIDFERPLYWPFNKINQFALHYIGYTPFVQNILKNIQAHNTKA